MARRAEEEENHWPGFVDALSTIVMVVTFLLIILVVVIVVISQQVSPITDTQDEETTGVQVASLEADLADVTQQLIEQSKTVEQQEKVIEEISQTVEQKNETIEEQETTIQILTESARQVEVADLGNTPQVQAETPIVETEIVVPRVDENVVTQNLRSDVETAQAVMTVLFEENAIELDEPSRTKATNFLAENAVVASGQKVVAMSYYDADSISVSQAKRIAYYRLLSVRNALLDSGVAGANISASVQPASVESDGSSNENRVKVFLR